MAIVSCALLWAGFRHLGRSMPRYLLPMMAATVVIGYGVYAEYTWNARTTGALPASYEVLVRGEERTALAPWTWIWPRAVRLSAIDLDAIRHHPTHPELRLVEVFLLERFHPTRRVRQLVHCADQRGADVAHEPVFTSNGMPVAHNWRAVDTDDRLLVAACGTII